MAKSVSTSPKSWKRHQKHWPCFSYSTFAWSELNVDQSSFWGVQIHYLSKLHQILSVLRLSDGEERSTSPKSWKRHQKLTHALFVNTISGSELNVDQSIIILSSAESLFVRIAPNFISIAIEWWRRAFHFPEIMKTTPKTLTMLLMLGANWMLINHHFEECRFIICQNCTKFYQYCDWVMAKSVPLPRNHENDTKNIDHASPILGGRIWNVDQSSFWGVQIHYLSRIAPNFISIAIEWWRRAFHFPEIMKTTPKTLTMLLKFDLCWEGIE